MKKFKLINLMVSKTAMAAVILCVLTLVLTSCEKDMDMFDYKPIENPNPPVEGEYTLTNQDLRNNPRFVTEMNHGTAVDTMVSRVMGVRGAKEYMFEKNPLSSVNATAENGEFGVKETYALNLNGISFKPMQVNVENIDGFYNRTQPWEGSMKVDNQNVTLDGKTLDFSKFFSPEEKVLQLGYTVIDSLAIGGYTIESESGEYVSGSDKVKDVLYNVTLKLYRSKYAASKIEEKDAKAGTRSVTTKATKSASDLIENVTFQVVRTVKAGVVPEDQYTGYGNVRQNIVVNWVKSVVEYEIIADEYYTISGTKTVLVEKGELPFGFSASPLCTYESKSKIVNHGNDSEEINSDSEVNLRQKHTMVSTYAFDLADGIICNKAFTFWWTAGAAMFHGERININVPAPAQVFAGISQKNETSDDTYKTITTYDVKNTISFGGNKTNASEIVVKVKKDAIVPPVTIKDVKISQSKVEEDARTKVTVIADITYSDNTTAKKDTVVYRAHGASNASDINVTKDDKKVVFVSNNVSSSTSGNRINYTNDVTVKYINNTTDVMSFASFQEEGGSIVFMGQTVEIVVAAMTPAYVSLVEGSTVINGKFDVTSWVVNAKSVIGAKTLAQKGNITVSVEVMEHPELGRLLGATASRTLSAVNANLLHNIIVLRYEKGFVVDVDGTLQSEIWKNENFNPSILNSINSAVHANGKFIPGVHNVHEGKDGYWEWYMTNPAGQKVYTTYPYKFNPSYSNKPNYCKRTVTFEFVGDQMVVYENGVQIRSFSRR